MMTKKGFGFVASLLGYQNYVLALLILVGAKTEATEIRVQFEGNFWNGRIEMQIGDKKSQETLSGPREITFAIHQGEGASVDVKMDYTPSFIFGARKHWSTSVVLNGSGSLELSVGTNETIKVGQWPVVVWRATSKPMDVFINGQSSGSTELKKGVKPDVTHNYMWKRDNKEMCRKDVALPRNLQRTYRCVDSTGVVVEE